MSQQEPILDAQDHASVIELLEKIAKALVDKPAEVEVQTEPTHDGTELLLFVAPEDIGKVIGRQGRTARSLRTLLAAISMKLRHRYTLDIVEEEELEDEEEGGEQK